MPNATARLIAAATIATLIACSSSGTITNVTIDGGNRTISLGDTPTLTATVEVTGNANQTITWTSSNDISWGIATDTDGNIYTTGYTLGALEGSNAGSREAFIRSYESNGTHRWTRPFGTNSDDIARGIATDTKGNVYTTGETFGALDGSNAGGLDAFIRSYGR